MSGELVFGLWFFFCGMAGAWSVSRNFDHNREGIAWKIEVVLTLAAFAVATVLLAFAIYSRVAS